MTDNEKNNIIEEVKKQLVSQSKPISAIAENAIRVNYAELKALRDAGTLLEGRVYRLTDYAFTTTQEGTKSAGHAFDLLIKAESSSTLSEVARAIQHDGDTYFASAKLSAWLVWYSLDNDTARFAWADAENGKGVIYRLVDEHNNDCGYDFKNAMFLRKAGLEIGSTVLTKDVYFYTFTLAVPAGESEVEDSSLIRKNVRNNYIGTPEDLTLSKNVFVGTTYEYNNICGSQCYSNTFGYAAYFNTITGWFYNNNIKKNFAGNSISGAIDDSVFNGDARYNTFSGYVQHNTFSGYVQHNTFSGYVQYNTFSGNVHYNTFSGNVTYNTFSGYYEYNNIEGTIGEVPCALNLENCTFKGRWYNFIFKGKRGSLSDKVAMTAYTVRGQQRNTDYGGDSSKQHVIEITTQAYNASVTLQEHVLEPNSKGDIVDYVPADALTVDGYKPTILANNVIASPRLTSVSQTDGTAHTMLLGKYGAEAIALSLSVITAKQGGVTAETLATLSVGDELISSLADNAFAGCAALSSVTIPRSIKAIGTSAFSGCTALATVKYLGSIAEWNSIAKGTDWASGIAATTINCADGSVSTAPPAAAKANRIMLFADQKTVKKGTESGTDIGGFEDDFEE